MIGSELFGYRPGTGRVTRVEVGPDPRNIAIGEGAVRVTVHPHDG